VDLPDWFDLRTSDGEGTNAGGGYEFDIGTVLVPCIYSHRRPEVTRSQGCLSRALEQKFSARVSAFMAAVAAASEQRSRCMK